MVRWIEPRFLAELTLALELELGSSRVISTVVDADGCPQSDARATLTGLGRPVGESVDTPLLSGFMTDASGVATITGVTPGRYVAYGSHACGSLQSIEFEVTPETDVPVRLSLVGKRRPMFEIVSAQGLPLAKTWVGLKSDTVMLASMRRTDGTPFNASSGDLTPGGVLELAWPRP